MPLYSSDALILRTYQLGEADRIVVFLTSDRGKRRGVAKNARRSRRRFGGALEPLTGGRVEYQEREGRDLVLLHFVEPVRSPLSSRDAEGPGYASYFAELIDACAPDADPNTRLYRLGRTAVDAIASGVPLDALARYVEFWVLRLQGIYPAQLPVSPVALDFLRVAGQAPPEAVAGVGWPDGVLRELEEAHRVLIMTHLEREPKSIRVLREMRRA
ncbi:MAG TPA: DNA repair protein RecO [Vicinamibacterales bacterium]